MAQDDSPAKPVAELNAGLAGIWEEFDQTHPDAPITRVDATTQIGAGYSCDPEPDPGVELMARTLALLAAHNRASR